jgi:hypothetical protein
LKHLRTHADGKALLLDCGLGRTELAGIDGGPDEVAEEGMLFDFFGVEGAGTEPLLGIATEKLHNRGQRHYADDE